MAKTIKFKCTVSPLVSAIKVTGDGSGMRILFDIPETELANALGILTMRESVLEVTIDDIGKAPLKTNSDIDNLLNELNP